MKQATFTVVLSAMLCLIIVRCASELGMGQTPALHDLVDYFALLFFPFLLAPYPASSKPPHVRQQSSVFMSFLSFLYAYISPYLTIDNNTHVYKTALQLVEEGIRI